MNPNAREPDNQGSTQGGIVAEKPVNNISPNSLSDLQDVVDAAKKEAAAAQTPAPQTPVDTSIKAFVDQFGEPATTPIAEPAPDLMGQALGGVGTTPPAVDASTPPEQTQPAVEAEAQPGPEQTPAEKLKQQIADSIDAFLEEVTQKQGVTS